MGEVVEGRKRGRGPSVSTRRELFLAELATHCDVGRAARAAGVSVSALYAWRQAEPGFADAWAQALAMGYQMLETRLIAHALAGAGAGEEAGPVEGQAPGQAVAALPPLQVDLALKLVTQRRPGAVREGASRRVPAPPPPADDKFLEVLLDRLDLIERRKRAAAARAATEAAMKAERADELAVPALPGGAWAPIEQPGAST